MSFFGTNLDIDRLIVSYLNPPQILSMSEVNQYFCTVVKVPRTQFIQVKYKIKKALENKYEQIIQWHIRSIPISLDRYQQDNCEINKESDMCKFYIEYSFLHNNFALTQFLLEIAVDACLDPTVIFSRHLQRIFWGEVDIKFIRHVDDCLRRIYDYSISDLMYSEDPYGLFYKMIEDKKYEEAIYYHRIVKTPCARTFKYELDNDLDSFAQFDMNSEFLIPLFNLFGIHNPHYYALIQSCGAKDDNIFFELIEKYSFDISYQTLFFAACRGGHLSVVKWLWTNAADPIDLDATEASDRY